QNANADPEGVDREMGRIWRVVYTGDHPGAKVASRPAVNMNLSEASSAELGRSLSHANAWQRRMAQRLLNERRDVSTKPALETLLSGRAGESGGKRLETRLAALWTLHGAELLDEATLDRCAADTESAIRAWAARLTGERRLASEAAQARLLTLAS